MSRRGLAWVLTGILVVLAGALWWGYSTFFYERANPSAIDYPVRGIDISAHNGEIDFEALAGAGLHFVYVKATEGADFIDRRFGDNVRGLTAKGIPTGAYHFFRFDTDGEMQAWNFIHALHGRNLPLRPAIDVEEWANAKEESTGVILKELNAFVNILRNEGYNPLIYTNKDGFQRFMQGMFNDEPLWLCSFTDPPLRQARYLHMWQYSHRGSVPGISGPVDLNAAPAFEPLLNEK